MEIKLDEWALPPKSKGILVADLEFQISQLAIWEFILSKDVNMCNQKKIL